MKFNLEDYEPVEDRIKRFYADHEDGRITAELLSDPNNIATTVVKAYLYLGENLVATGLAFEKAGEGYVNKTSHLENCETSAIGRALANYNYAGNKRASREEMTKAKGPEKSPRDGVIAKIGEQVKVGDYNDAQKAQLREDIKKADLAKLEGMLEALKAGDYFFDDDIPFEEGA
jgi:hypothetical protein